MKTGRKLVLLTPETLTLLGSTKKDVDSDKSSENVQKLESVNTEFSFAKVWFTDQTSKALEIEDNVNLT